MSTPEDATTPASTPPAAPAAEAPSGGEGGPADTRADALGSTAEPPREALPVEAPREAPPAEGAAPALEGSPAEGLAAPREAPIAAPVAVEPPVPSGPYRTPPHEPHVTPRPPRGWPVVGPALGTFGVLLWSFVVAGQLTTSWTTGRPLGQTGAVFVVFVATVSAWILSVRRSLSVSPAGPSRAVARALGVGVLALFTFFTTVLLAVAAGATTRKNHDMGIAFTMVVVAIVALVLGRRLTSPDAPDRTHGQRFVVVALWLVSLLVTVVAGADLATNG